MSLDRITLTLPARGEYARTVRMTAAELASRMGMSLDDIDDVRIAVEEAFVFTAEHAGDDGEVTFSFIMHPDAIEAEAWALGEACGEPGEDDAEGRYARFILESVCDEFEMLSHDDECRIRLLKRVG